MSEELNKNIRDFFIKIGEDIKRAFRHHAKASHPDLNKRDPNASARFKKVAEAYTILSDPIKKKRVDDI